jgi:hypothetical protein
MIIVKLKQRKSFILFLCDPGPTKFTSHLGPFHFCVTSSCWPCSIKSASDVLHCMKLFCTFTASMHYLLFFMVCHHTCSFAGSLVLVGGDPGVGKSSLMLQVNVHMWLFILNYLISYCISLSFQLIKITAFSYLLICSEF